MKSLLTLVTICISFGIYGQQVTNSIISSIGANLETENNSIEVTAGELVVSSLQGDSSYMTGGIFEGVLAVTSVFESPEYEVKINIYPNPTSNKVTLDFPDDLNHLSVVIFNVNGKMLRTFTEVNNNSIIDFSIFPKGIYFIKIEENNQYISSKKVIKK